MWGDKTWINLGVTLAQIRKRLPQHLRDADISFLSVLRSQYSANGKDWAVCKLTNGECFTLFGPANQICQFRPTKKDLWALIHSKKAKGYEWIAEGAQSGSVSVLRLVPTYEVNPVPGTPTEIPLNKIPLNSTPSAPKPQAKPEPARKRLAQVIDDWVGSERTDWF